MPETYRELHRYRDWVPKADKPLIRRQESLSITSSQSGLAHCEASKRSHPTEFPAPQLGQLKTPSLQAPQIAAPVSVSREAVY
jgi:hypothetical protein